ncbi:MAG: delta-60 repeat domain-containing protein, partial [Chthoniobacterales bacterium]
MRNLGITLRCSSIPGILSLAALFLNVSAFAQLPDNRLSDLGGSVVIQPGQNAEESEKTDSSPAQEKTPLPVLRVEGTIYAMLLQPDGKIVIGGEISTVSNQPVSNLARLLPDGSLDTDFKSKLVSPPRGTVYAL